MSRARTWRSNTAGLRIRVDRIPELAAELVRRQVAVIVTSGGTRPAFAAKAATTTIPIVFFSGEDPVRLASSPASPGQRQSRQASIFSFGELATKRYELLRELVPKAVSLAVLLNPIDSASAEATMRDVKSAARGTGLQIQALNASTYRGIDAASHICHTSGLMRYWSAPTHSSPAVASNWLSGGTPRDPCDLWVREIAEAGGLMSYGTNLYGRLASDRRLYRSHSQGCETRRPAGRAVDQVRARHQPQTAECSASKCRPLCSPAPTR